MEVTDGVEGPGVEEVGEGGWKGARHRTSDDHGRFVLLSNNYDVYLVQSQRFFDICSPTTSAR